jgi:hypothetical protein
MLHKRTDFLSESQMININIESVNFVEKAKESDWKERRRFTNSSQNNLNTKQSEFSTISIQSQYSTISKQYKFNTKQNQTIAKKSVGIIGRQNSSVVFDHD